MVAPIKVEAFGGMAPAIASELLLPNAASYAVNAWLDLGTLTGFYEQTLLVSAPAEIGKVYRIPLVYDAAYQFENSKWMFFTNPDTDIVRGSVFGDIYDRYYWASSTAPPQYNTRARIIADDPPWLLGIPTPASAPALIVTGGAAVTTVTRSYVVTYVSAYGEEGAPSPPVTVTGKPDGSWDLSALPVPDVADMGVDRNITLKRIYRTITGSSGVATFFMVVELPATTLTYSDTIPDADITGSNQLEPVPFTPPPADLEGFCLGQNGILAGWRGSEVWFTHAYRPHAWPSLYVVTCEYPIVGMASIGQTFFVMTLGYPVTISGSTPGTLVPGRVSMFEPCTSRGGIVTFQEGVYYPSGNGLILLQSGAAYNATKGLITKERWQTYVQGARFRAGKLGTNAYYGFGTKQFGVFQEDAFQNDAFAMEDFSGLYNGILIDTTNPRLGLMLLTTEVPVNNVQNDAWSSELIVLKENDVFWMNLTDTQKGIVPYEWRSKLFGMQWPCSLSAAKVYFNIPPSTPAQNPVRDTAQDQVLDAGKYGIITWYGDGRKLAVHEIRKSGEMFRLPADTKYNEFSFTIQGRVEITAVHVTSSAKELRAI